MSISRRMILLSAFLLLALAVAQPAAAQTLAPGAYCVSCHTAGDPALISLAAWQARAPDEAPCPGVKAYREQLLYTEQLLAATEHASQVAGPRAAAAQSGRLAAFRAGLASLREARVTSLDAFTMQAQLLRFQGAKVYAAFNDAIDAGRRNWVLTFAVLATLVMLASLGWGLRNTLAAGRLMPGWWRAGLLSWRTVAIAGLTFLLFALPLFRVPTAAVVLPTADEQAVQTVLDTSGRVADTADRALARAWMLARVAAAWSGTDPAAGRSGLDAALAAAGEAQAYADALWGQAQAAREAAIGSPAAQDEAALLAAQLESVRSRAWGLRLIAAEWSAVDPSRAAQIMAQAQALAGRNRTPYGQVDLAAIAVDWARLDSQRAVSAARAVADPALRARAEGLIAATAAAAPPPYTLAVDRLVPAGSGVAAARELLAAQQTEADKAEVLRFIAASTGARADFDQALVMALAARVRGDPLAPAEASLALARAMLPVDRTLAARAFAQAFDIAQKTAVKYK